MTEPVTQAQDHDRRIGRLEGIAEQIGEQGRQNSARFDRIEQAIAEQGRQHQQALAEQGRQHQQALAEQGHQLNARIDSQEQRQAAQFRWLIGVQITTLLAIGSLLFSILSRLPE